MYVCLSHLNQPPTRQEANIRDLGKRASAGRALRRHPSRTSRSHQRDRMGARTTRTTSTSQASLTTRKTSFQIRRAHLRTRGHLRLEAIRQIPLSKALLYEFCFCFGLGRLLLEASLALPLPLPFLVALVSFLAFLLPDLKTQWHGGFFSSSRYGPPNDMKRTAWRNRYTFDAFSLFLDRCR